MAGTDLQSVSDVLQANKNYLNSICIKNIKQYNKSC